MFDDNDLKVLSKYEQQFTTALRAGYARGVLCRDLEAFVKIWEEKSGKPLVLNCGCSACCLSVLKTIGKQYFRDKEERAKEFVKVLDDVFEYDTAELKSEPSKSKKAPAKNKNNKATNKKNNGKDR